MTMNQVIPAWTLNKQIVDEFHKLFYSRGAIEAGPDGIKMPVEANYLGVHVQKNPLDLWVYQEILFEKKPDLIIECGTAAGGTTLFLAHILDQLDNGEIISIDIANRSEILPVHPRINYVFANTCDYVNTTGKIKDYLVRRSEASGRPQNVMVILDSDHTEEHVYRELLMYSCLVSVGQYLIVEDTNINGYPVGVKRDPGGPTEAVNRFLSETSQFVVDHSREKFLMTFNPGGYLKKVK